MELKDKVAWITGASSGIGRETAKLFAKEGARVAILGRRRQALQQLDSEIRDNGGECLVTRADVQDLNACEDGLSRIIDTFGRLDILVNAAGIIGSGTAAETSMDEWRTMMNINLDSVFCMMQICLPHLEQSKGSIVNVSSVTGLRAFPGVLAYCVSKAGVDQLTRCAALELAPKGVRINAVNPGVVVTNLHKSGGMDDDKYADFLEHSKTTHPIGRVGRPEELAEAILYLASQRSGWVTGLTMSVDGGRHLTCAR